MDSPDAEETSSCQKHKGIFQDPVNVITMKQTSE